MELKKAYQMVFSDLCHSSGMLQGHYDAINGNPHFMVGIETVMEVIANRAYDEQYAETFADIFAVRQAYKEQLLKEGGYQLYNDMHDALFSDGEKHWGF